MTNPRIRNLLHADRVWRLMSAGLTLDEAANLDDESAELMLEAWEIAMDGGGDEDGVTITFIGPN